MSEEFRPCPFCGKKPNPNWTDESYIECTNRKCSVYGYGMSTGDWNTRPIEDKLRKRIAELESAQRWIPVSERLPEENVTVLVVTKRNRKPVVAWMRLGLWCSRGVDFALSVTHWMPLPESPNDTQTQTFVYGKVCER